MATARAAASILAAVSDHSYSDSPHSYSHSACACCSGCAYPQRRRRQRLLRQLATPLGSGAAESCCSSGSTGGGGGGPRALWSHPVRRKGVRRGGWGCVLLHRRSCACSSSSTVSCAWPCCEVRLRRSCMTCMCCTSCTSCITCMSCPRDSSARWPLGSGCARPTGRSHFSQEQRPRGNAVH